MTKKVFALLLIFVLLAGPVFAAQPSPWTKEADWTGKSLSKLGYGLKNVVLGWTEIFTQPSDAAKKGGNVVTGVGKGLWNAVADTLGGAIHTVTFFIPVDVPLPDGGVSLM